MTTKRIHALYLVIATLLAGCFSADDAELAEPVLTIEQIKVAEDDFLNRLLERQFGQAPQGKGLNSSFGEILVENAVKVYSPEKNTTRYSLLLRSDLNLGGFDNFIIKEQDGALFQYVLSYLPDPQWLASQYPSPDWSSYTGKLTAYRLDGSVLAEDYLVEGISQAKASKGGRTLECYACDFEVKESTITGNEYVEVNCEDGSGFILFRTECGDTSDTDAGESGTGDTGGGSSGDGTSSGGGDGTDGGTLGGGSTGSGDSSSGDLDTESGDPIGILPPEDLKALMEEKIAQETNPEEIRRLQLQYIRTHNGEEGREFADIMEELLATPGITVGEVSDINEAVNHYYLHLRGLYYMAIFGPVAEAAKPFIELALFETGSGVLFQSVKALLSVRWGVQIAKLGINTTTISALTTRMVNAVKIAANRATVSLKIGGRNLTGSAVSTTSSSRVAYHFPNTTTVEAKAIFQEMTAGRTITRVEMGGGQIGKTAVWRDANGVKNSITLRSFSKSEGSVGMVIDIKMPAIRVGKLELKFFI